MITAELAEQYHFPVEEVVKADMLANGVVMSDRLREKLEVAANGPIGAEDGYPTTEDPTYILVNPENNTGDTWVTAGTPTKQGGDVPPRLIETQSGDLVVVASDGYEQPAWLVLPALSHNRKLASGDSVMKYVAIHGLRARFSLVQGNPIDGEDNKLGPGCALSCGMCPLAKSESGYSGIRPLIDDLAEVAEIVEGERRHPANKILISGGAPRSQDNELFQETCYSILKAFPKMEVDLMAVPMPGSLDFEALKEYKLHGLSLNMEAHWDTDFAREALKAKLGLQKRGSYRDAINKAVNLGFAVRSLVLIPGEMTERDERLTLRLIEEIADLGASPILSPLQADKDAPIYDLPEPGLTEILRMAQKTKAIVQRRGNAAISHTVRDPASGHNVFPSSESPIYTVPGSQGNRQLNKTFSNLPQQLRAQYVYNINEPPI